MMDQTGPLVPQTAAVAARYPSYVVDDGLVSRVLAAASQVWVNTALVTSQAAKSA